jgi:Zn-dependent peptidase ImmA (M78 family)
VPKVRPFSERAVAAARRILDDAGVRDPEPIDVEAIAAKNGAMVVYGAMRTARAMIVRRGRSAIVHIDQRHRGRAIARFTTAHELVHHVLHAHADHYRQCVTDYVVREEGDYEIEREANDGATELLIPEHLGAPFCAGERATVEAIDRLARTFGTSFEMSAIRMTELTMAPCAVVSSENGRVKWAVESLTFPGTVRRGQRVGRGTVAARVARGVRKDREEGVEGAVWKSREGLVERAWRVGEGKVISWIVGVEGA